MKIKHIFAVLAVGLLVAPLAQAQEAATPKDSVKTAPPSDKMKTLFSSMKNPLKKKDGSPKLRYLGLYIAPEAQYGQVAGEGTTLSGVSGMLLLNKHWGVGLAGYATTERNFTPASVGQRLNVMYGGGKIEYTAKPNSVLHVSFPLLIGGGYATNQNNFGFDFGGRGGNKDRGGFDGNGGRNGSSFGVIQPGINVEMNVFRYAKVFAGANYRLALGVNNRASTTTTTTPLNLTNSQLSGLSANVGLKVGVFDYSLQKKAKKNKEVKKQEGKEARGKRGFWHRGRERG